jgi:hypothetical protein
MYLSCYYSLVLEIPLNFVTIFKVIRRTVPRNNFSKCLFYILYYIKNKKIEKIKHLEELLGGTVLLITLIKYEQQDAEPQK